MKTTTETSRLLARQFGVVAKTQLLELGISPRTVERSRDAGNLVEVLPYIFRSGLVAESFETKAMAVQLYTAPDGALSGPTAARLLGMRGMPSAVISAMIWRRIQAGLPRWVSLSRSSWFDPWQDAVTVRGFRVVRPLRMLLSLAEVFNDYRFERAAEDAWHLHLVEPADAATYLDLIRRRGRAGVDRFERWLKKTSERTRASQSGFELDVIDAVRRAGLPEPRRQHPVTLPNGEVVHLDVAWPEVMLAVEPGHTWWHGGDLRTRADQARDRACGEIGWYVMRYDESHRADLSALGAEVLRTYQRRRQLHSHAAAPTILTLQQHENPGSQRQR